MLVIKITDVRRLVILLPKQQDVVALSSAESELISACSATQSAVYIRQLLTDLGFKQDEPTVIMEDNQACIAMGNNPITHKRTKHIDVRYHFVREKVESKEVELVYIPTQHQLADILTKPLSNIRLAMIRNRMMGYKDERYDPYLKYASYRINCFGSYIMIRSTTILQCCTYILDGSNSLYRDVLIATVSCHGLRPPNHLYVILSYDNRTGVDQCLWLSLVVGRIGYLSTRFLGESIGLHSQGE
ncbi:putative polyprotein [Nannochloropsis gaditana]|uniref:Putative polyprotein n=1 Tax=Nannochloropsis gaditana TaxID=72520 RepID=W7SYU7_9STRA|nr:putative polyprotein [Nannochloropsis gaditana]